MRNRNIGLILAAFAIATMTAIGLAYKIQRVNAFNPQPDPPGFGMVGLAQRQTLRISVVNTNPAPPAGSPPDPCRVVMNFRDGNNNLFLNNNGTPLRRVVQLNGGESTSLDLNAEDFGRMMDGTGRLQLRPVVSIQQPDGANGIPPDPVIPTAEIFDNNNGKTQVIVPALLPAVQHAVRTAVN